MVPIYLNASENFARCLACLSSFRVINLLKSHYIKQARKSTSMHLNQLKLHSSNKWKDIRDSNNTQNCLQVPYAKCTLFFSTAVTENTFCIILKRAI